MHWDWGENANNNNLTHNSKNYIFPFISVLLQDNPNRFKEIPNIMDQISESLKTRRHNKVNENSNRFEEDALEGFRGDYERSNKMIILLPKNIFDMI